MVVDRWSWELRRGTCWVDVRGYFELGFFFSFFFFTFVLSLCIFFQFLVWTSFHGVIFRFSILMGWIDLYEILVYFDWDSRVRVLVVITIRIPYTVLVLARIDPFFVT